MNLLQNIRNDRVRQRRKHAHGREAFNTVSSIVKAYGLGLDFLEMLNGTVEFLPLKKMVFTEIKRKKVFDFPPFSLTSEREFKLTLAIISKLDNPYLRFAHSPEEMLLSAPLYEANPSLGSNALLNYDFETLLICQHAKAELANLEMQLQEISGTAGHAEEAEQFRGERTHLNFLQQQIRHLHTFIAKVENREFQAI